MKRMIYVVSLIALALLVFSCCSLKKGNDGGKGGDTDVVNINDVKVTPEEMVTRYHYSSSSGMMCYTDDNGERYTNEGEMTLEKTDKGGMLYLRYEYVKHDSVAVGDEVFEHISKLVKAYKLEENSGSYTDSDMFVTDVGPWSCSVELKNGTSVFGSVIMAFEVKDKKRMKRCDNFVKGVSAINSYLRPMIKH
jgi:hypothetical protein